MLLAEACKLAFKLYIIFFMLSACNATRNMQWPYTKNTTGILYYTKASTFQWKQRDSLTRQYVLQGATPRFLRKFVKVKTSWVDSSTGKWYRAAYYVSPDYLSVGTNEDWARVHITPFLAQELADSMHCFLPTRKMVDQIYTAARQKLTPIPMTKDRDSTPTFYQHHLAIEAQRKGKKGLIAGIQKDLVTTGRLYGYPKRDRVAIYGWHQPNGKPIQLLYTGHVYWYVDYSQGVRLVYEKIRLNGKWIPYQSIFNDPILKNLLCDEPDCGDGRYPFPLLEP